MPLAGRLGGPAAGPPRGVACASRSNCGGTVRGGGDAARRRTRRCSRHRGHAGFCGRQPYRAPGAAELGRSAFAGQRMRWRAACGCARWPSACKFAPVACRVRVHSTARCLRAGVQLADAEPGAAADTGGTLVFVGATLTLPPVPLSLVVRLASDQENAVAGPMRVRPRDSLAGATRQGWRVSARWRAACGFATVAGVLAGRRDAKRRRTRRCSGHRGQHGYPEF